MDTGKNISILAFSFANKERKQFFVLRNAQKPNELNTIEYHLDCKETQQLNCNFTEGF